VARLSVGLVVFQHSRPPQRQTVLENISRSPMVCRGIGMKDGGRPGDSHHAQRQAG